MPSCCVFYAYAPCLLYAPCTQGRDDRNRTLAARATNKRHRNMPVIIMDTLVVHDSRRKGETSSRRRQAARHYAAGAPATAVQPPYLLPTSTNAHDRAFEHCVCVPVCKWDGVHFFCYCLNWASYVVSHLPLVGMQHTLYLLPACSFHFLFFCAISYHTTCAYAFHQFGQTGKYHLPSLPAKH